MQSLTIRLITTPRLLRVSQPFYTTMTSRTQPIQKENDITQKKMPNTFIDGFHDKHSCREMEYRQLGNTNMMVSKLSYGVSALGSVFRQTNDEEGMKVVHEAIKSGINWIDAAPWYGNGKGETVLGKALAKYDIPRKAYYLSTKVCRYEPDVVKMFDFSAKRVIQSVDESLERMGVDYVDVIQIHDMEFAPSLDIIINETLPALQKVKESGKAKYIGITGYPLENFRTVIERSQVKIDAILTYCHYSLNDTSLLDYLQYFKEKGIGVINASPNGMGLLTNNGPPKWHVASQDIKTACQNAANYCKSVDVDISKLAVNFTCNLQEIPTTLVSTASLINLNKNVTSACEVLTENETATLDFIKTEYFEPLKNRNWEGIEVENYKTKLSSIKNGH